MELWDAIRERHSVRRFKTLPIEEEKVAVLRALMEEGNAESGLNIQLLLNEPNAFDSLMSRYGRFSGVRNYIALVGRKGDSFEEKCGYYGEKLVLKAQTLGLNTCWVGISYSKSKAEMEVKDGEKLLLVIALGYGEDSGAERKSKPLSKLCERYDEMPNWFRKGVESAALAPTAVNQQKFFFALDGDKVKASTGLGFYSKVDLGIAKYHFEIGAAGGEWSWA